MNVCTCLPFCDIFPGSGLARFLGLVLRFCRNFSEAFDSEVVKGLFPYSAGSDDLGDLLGRAIFLRQA
jgi:hypothetical protein